MSTATSGGPKIFLDYDQAALDAAYDQVVYAPNREQIDKRNNANSLIDRGSVSNKPEGSASQCRE